jgi:hypothetical protein
VKKYSDNFWFKGVNIGQIGQQFQIVMDEFVLS